MISGDATETVQAVADACGVPGAELARSGADLPDEPGALRVRRRRDRRLRPDHPGAEAGAGGGPGAPRPLRRDDRRRRQRRACAQGGPPGDRDGIGQPDRQGRLRPRAPARGVRDRAPGDRGGQADHPQHAPGRQALRHEDGLRRRAARHHRRSHPSRSRSCRAISPSRRRSRSGSRPSSSRSRRAPDPCGASGSCATCWPSRCPRG